MIRSKPIARVFQQKRQFRFVVVRANLIEKKKKKKKRIKKRDDLQSSRV